jgi:hypothetical protein
MDDEEMAAAGVAAFASHWPLNAGSSASSHAATVAAAEEGADAPHITTPYGSPSRMPLVLESPCLGGAERMPERANHGQAVQGGGGERGGSGKGGGRMEHAGAHNGQPVHVGAGDVGYVGTPAPSAYDLPSSKLPDIPTGESPDKSTRRASRNSHCSVDAASSHMVQSGAAGGTRVTPRGSSSSSSARTLGWSVDDGVPKWKWRWHHGVRASQQERERLWDQVVCCPDTLHPERSNTHRIPIVLNP